MRIGIATGLLVLALTAHATIEEQFRAWQPVPIQEILGDELYLLCREHGVPRPPSLLEANQLSPFEWERQRNAIKRALLHFYERLRRERHRENSENLLATANLAERLGAPAAYVAQMRMKVTGNMSRTQSYVLERALRETISRFGVDVVQIRLVVEAVQAGPADIERFLELVPIEAVFNMTANNQPSVDQITRDIYTYAGVMEMETAIMQGIMDKKKAEEAVSALVPLLLLHDTTQPTRVCIMQGAFKPQNTEQTAASRRMQKASNALLEQRRRLYNASFFGSKVLRMVDYLLQ